MTSSMQIPTASPALGERRHTPHTHEKGKGVPRRGKDNVKQTAEKITSKQVRIQYSPRLRKMMARIAEYYAARHDAFEDKHPMYRAGEVNQAAVIQIVIQDWIDGLRKGEKADADTLEHELQEYYAVSRTHERDETGRTYGRQTYFTDADFQRYDTLLTLLRDQKDSIHYDWGTEYEKGRAVGSPEWKLTEVSRAMIIAIAIARYVRIHLKRSIGFCDDMD